MTPKEKAQELYRTYIDYTYGDFNCKQCTLIAVNEIIELYEFHAISNPDDKRVIDTLNYFDQVKQEIEKL